jgi:heptosyltransferase-3
VSKILVIRGGAIGDFILTLPVLSALRQQFPDVRLEVLGYPHIAQLAIAGGLADEVRSIEARSLAGFFARDPALDPALQEYFASFPVIISYLYDPDRIFQTNVQRTCKGQFIAAPHRPDEARGRHATEVFLEPLTRLAIFDADPVARLPLSAEPKPSGKCVALHPGSGSEQKNWPLQNWVSLAEALLQDVQTSLLVVGGEAESGKIDMLAERLPRDRVDVAFAWPLPKLGRRLAACTAFVGHDSGITHLAAAVSIPTIALWGSTSEALWRPKGKNVTVLREPSGLAHLGIERVVESLRLNPISSNSAALPRPNH